MGPAGTRRLVGLLAALVLFCLLLALGLVVHLAGKARAFLGDRTVTVITAAEHSCKMPPLHVAAWNWRHAELRRLLDTGGNPNRTQQGVLAETPLHLAAVGDRRKAARRLVEHGADVNVQSEYLGVTPLYLASVAGHTRMARLLEKHGADDGIPDAYGLTPRRARALWDDAGRRQLETIEAGQGGIDPRCLVRVYWLGQRSDRMQSSTSVLGFVADPGGRVVTAEHCLAPMRRMERDGYLVRPLVLSAFLGDVFEASVEHIDEAADAAVLRVSWPGHPAFELAEGHEVEDAAELMIAGHPPDVAGAARGAFGRLARAETLPVLRYRPDAGKRALIMGPRRFVGPGWSGAPILTPGTGKVAGVFGTREVWRYGPATVISNLEGCSSDALRETLRTLPPAPKVEAPADAREAYEVLVDLLEGIGIDDPAGRRDLRDAALAIRPQSAMVRLLAMALRRASDPDRDAMDERDLQAALRMAPDSPLVHGAQGLYLIERDRRGEAGPSLDRALELAPDLVFCRLWKARLMLDDDPAGAEQVVRAADDERGVFLFELSRILARQARPEESLEALRKACASFDDHAEIPHAWVRGMADALKKNGSFEESETWYRRLFETHECPRCWLAYAGLLRKLGEDRKDDLLEALGKAEAGGGKLTEADTRFLERLRREHEEADGETDGHDRGS